MAFGIPGSEPASSGPFLGRIQYDARVGFWKVVKRVQDMGGEWSNDEGDPFPNPTLLMDMGSLEVGYIRMTGTPSFLVVPYGRAIPEQPAETTKNALGKDVKAFMPGFRMKVMSDKIFGDDDAYFFSGNSKTLMNPVEEIYLAFEAAKEARTGKIPLVACKGTKTIEVVNKMGTAKFKAPIFSIVSWHERPGVFGERTVPAPGSTAPAKELETVDLDDEVPF